MLTPKPGTLAARCCVWLIVLGMALRLLLPGLHTHTHESPRAACEPTKAVAAAHDDSRTERADDCQPQIDEPDAHEHGCLACDLEEATTMPPPAPADAAAAQRLCPVAIARSPRHPVVHRYRSHPSRAPPHQAHRDSVLTPA